jgi:hypothetical protein
MLASNQSTCLGRYSFKLLSHQIPQISARSCYNVLRVLNDLKLVLVEPSPRRRHPASPTTASFFPGSQG